MLPIGTLAADAAERLIEHMAGTPAHAKDREQRRRLARLCGHLPLALRIVAARLTSNPQWTVGDLVAELTDERSRLGALDLEAADTSVRAALDVTYRSLRPEHARTVCFLGLFPGTRIGPQPVAALCDIDVADARRRLRALADSFVVTETQRDVFGMHDLVRLHATELAQTELSEVDRSGAARRLLRYYLTGADAALRLLRPEATKPLLNDEFPELPTVRLATAQDAAEWIDQEWPNLLAVVEAGTEPGADPEVADEVVMLARRASEFSARTQRRDVLSDDVTA